MQTAPSPTTLHLTPGRVANLRRVEPTTATRWVAAGAVASMRSAGVQRGAVQVPRLLGAVPTQQL